MDLITDGLNAAQRAAVTSSAKVLQVLAPPGSGKTKTLTSRVAYMLRDLGYKPWNIICLTFTIKSSREMKERISKLVGHGIERQLVLGTFHSVCRRYLVAYGHLIGIKKDFGIADSSDTLNMIKRITKRQSLQIDPKQAQSRISNAKSKGLTLEDLNRMLAKKKDIEQQEMVILFDLYQRQLSASNLLDYDDLLLKCVELLQQCPHCVSNVEAVLVDEYQDTNVTQFNLLKLFASSRNTITTVGDPDQSIYGWRSAEVENIQRMRRQYPDTLVINLEENYRSSGAILLLAHELIEQDVSRPQKNLFPTHCPGVKPVLRLLPSAEIEALWIVKEILRTRALTGRMLDYGDFAILLRSASLSRLLETAMSRAGVPYRMVGGQRFFDRIEVKNLVDYLRTVSQPNNNDALARILNTPSRGIGTATLKALLEEAETRKNSLWDLIRRLLRGEICTQTKISKAAEQGLSSLTSLILTTRNKMLDLELQLSPAGVLELMIKKLNYSSFLKKSYPDDYEARWANIEELLAQASEFATSNSGPTAGSDADDLLPQIDGVLQEKENSAEAALSKFLSNVALTTELQKTDTVDGEGPVQLPVTISTIHAAKGLEWPVVFVPCVFNGCIPHSRAEDTDEERRLLYVAMTRAQGLLYTSCPRRSSQRDETALSAFLSTKQIKHHLSDQGPAIDSATVFDLSQILCRKQPSPHDIMRESCNLESRHDDLWPLNGEERTEAAQAKSTGTKDEYLSGGTNTLGKRRRFGRHAMGDGVSSRIGTKMPEGLAVSVGFTTTMQDQSAFTLPGSSFGFCTASAHLQLEKDQASHGSKMDHSKSGVESSDRSKALKSCQRAQKHTGTLLSLWGIEHKPTMLAEKTTDVNSIDSGWRPASGAVGNAIPQDLAAHRLQPLEKRLKIKELKACSSANVQGNGARSWPPPCADSFKDSDGGSKAIASPALPLEQPPRAVHGIKTSKTLQDPNRARRTLGVRRSMGGWSSRSKSAFSEPCIAPGQGAYRGVDRHRPPNDENAPS